MHSNTITNQSENYSKCLGVRYFGYRMNTGHIFNQHILYDLKYVMDNIQQKQKHKKEINIERTLREGSLPTK